MVASPRNMNHPGFVALSAERGARLEYRNTMGITSIAAVWICACWPEWWSAARSVQQDRLDVSRRRNVSSQSVRAKHVTPDYAGLILRRGWLPYLKTAAIGLARVFGSFQMRLENTPLPECRLLARPVRTSQHRLPRLRHHQGVSTRPLPVDTGVRPLQHDDHRAGRVRSRHPSSST